MCQRILIQSIALFYIILSTYSCQLDLSKGSETAKSSAEVSQSAYLEKVKTLVAELPEEKKNKRREKLGELQQSNTYKELIESKNVSSNYLPVLHAIANGITHINSEGYAVGQTAMENVQRMDKGDDAIKFVITTILLAQPQFGGLPSEFIELFERYKDKYRYYGDKGSLLQNVDTGESETIASDFDLSPFFVMINSSDQKALNALYEARKKGISNWHKKKDFVFPYISTKDGYNEHLKKVYPSSAYLVNVDYEMFAVELFRDYESNEVAGDEKYKGKKIAVTGKVEDIGKDALGYPYVSLYVDIMQSIVCYFSEDDIKILSKLKKGQKITIIGVCDGKMLNLSVNLKNCQIS